MLIANWILGLLSTVLVSVSLLGWGAALRHHGRLAPGVSYPAGLGVALALMSAVGTLPGGYTLIPQGLILLAGAALARKYRTRWSFSLQPNWDSLLLVFPVLYF